MNNFKKTTFKAVAFAGLLSLGAACGLVGDDPNCEDGQCEDPNGLANAVCQREAASLCEKIIGGQENVTAQSANENVFTSMRECAAQSFQACRDEVAYTGHCKARRKDSLKCESESIGTSYVPGALRWAAQDVNCVTTGSPVDVLNCSAPKVEWPDTDTTENGRGRGRAELVNGRFDERSSFDEREDANDDLANGAGGKDDRGQEYTEYFAVLQLPPKEENLEAGPPQVIGLVGSVNEPIDFTREFSDDDPSDDLTDHQMDQLLTVAEENPEQSFGSCVFTSWHQDNLRPLEVNGALPVPNNPVSWFQGDAYDLNITPGVFQMKIGINSNNAAADLVDNCTVAVKGMDFETAENLPRPARLSRNLDDTFDRGCMRTYELFTTEWRRSDPTICTAPMKLSECGCNLEVTVAGETVPVPVDAKLFLDDDRDQGWAAISKILVPSLGDSQTDFYEALAAVAPAGAVQNALFSFADRRNEEQFYLRGFPLGAWNDSDQNAQRVALGERLTGTPYQMSKSQCEAQGGSYDDTGSLSKCMVDTWGTKFASEALSAPPGCRYVQIAQTGSAFAENGSSINGGLGEHGRNIMVCDINFNALERVMANQGGAERAFLDMKSFCQLAYADQVVVHIPYQDRHIPEAKLACSPPEGMEAECALAADQVGVPASIVQTSVENAGVCDGAVPGEKHEADVIVREPLPDVVLEDEKRRVDEADQTEEVRRGQECKVVCVKGDPCGDGCIKAGGQCSKEPGVACKGGETKLEDRSEAAE